MDHADFFSGTRRTWEYQPFQEPHQAQLPIEAHPGGFMEGLAAALQVTQKAGRKMLIMAAFTIGIKRGLRHYNVPESIHDDIFIAVNVVLGKLADILLDEIMSPD